MTLHPAFTNFRRTAMAVLVAAYASTVCGCAHDPPEDFGDDGDYEAYSDPGSSIVRADSLTAFEVSPDGSFREVELFEQAGLTPKNWDWGDEGTHYPSNSGSFLEVEKVLQPGFVLTGIGARVGNDAVTRMRLRQIGIQPNWTWDLAGSIWTDWVRHPADDGKSFAELEISVAKPFVITGLGMRISSGNVSHIRVQKREYSPASHKLVNPPLLDTVGSGAAELYWDTSFITHPYGMLDKMVIVGVGLRENSDNLTTLKIYAAYLD